MLLLLPAERDLPAAEMGLRAACRDAAIRAGRPFAIVGRVAVVDDAPRPPAAPSFLDGVDPEPIFWICVGGAILGAIYLMTRKRRPESAETVYEQVVEKQQASSNKLQAQTGGEEDAAVVLPAPAAPRPRTLHPMSSDGELAAAFERDVEALWADDWRP